MPRPLINAAMRTTRPPMRETLKRLIDIIAGIALLIVTLPITLLVALGGRLSLGSLVFVRAHLGFGGCTVKLPNFRSMTDARDDAGVSLDDEHRTPPFGSFIRRYRGG